MTNIQNTQTLDLAKQAPRSPYETLGGYAVLARTIDKCRAFLAGRQGDYHFDCPVDNTLFKFVGVKGEEFKKYVAEGSSDIDILAWVKAKGTPKTDSEIKTWSEHFKSDYSYTTDPTKKDWFIGECKRLGLDPAKTTLFDYLVADDKVSFPA